VNIKKLCYNSTTFALWFLLFLLLIFWIGFCVSCAPVDLSWLDENGNVIKQMSESRRIFLGKPVSPSASPNPNIFIETRDFSRFKTDKEFMDWVKKKWGKWEITFKSSYSPRIGFHGEHVFFAIIWLDKKCPSQVGVERALNGK